ncbi:hypothetical protein B0A68_21065 [Flavobacterium reichenbachii]|nr:hypothetical protein B0A68_21065 [Flavobacterium reichenbachii]
MNKNSIWCSKVSDDVNCPKCNEKKVIKNVRTKNYKQQYYCKMYCHRFIESYTNFENRARKLINLPKRTTYGGKAFNID